MEDLIALIGVATSPERRLAERHEAFGEIVTRFQDMAYGCAYTVLGDFHLAEDAAQDAFVAAWQHLHQLRQPEAFPGWFRRIVLTQCNRITRTNRLRTISLDDDLTSLSTNTDPQHDIEKGELTGAVISAINLLPEHERIVMALYYVNEHSQTDIGAFLEIPAATVAKRLHSARARLKHLMLAEFKDILAEHLPSRNRRFTEVVKGEIYDAYVGQYQFEMRPDLIVTITQEEDKLISEAAGQRNELCAKSESEFRTTKFDGGGVFVKDDKGKVTHLIYYEFGQEMGAARKIS